MRLLGKSFGQEKNPRSERRIPPDLPFPSVSMRIPLVLYQLVGAAALESIPGTTVRVGVEGVLCRAARPFSIPSIVSVELQLPGRATSGRGLRLFGHVVGCDKCPGDGVSLSSPQYDITVDIERELHGDLSAWTAWRDFSREQIDRK